MLYSLAEFQSGNATTIRIEVEGSEFSVADDGRGHPIDKVVDGTSYFNSIYMHHKYPFKTGHGAPIQLQGIGMSLVNALCSELALKVTKRAETLQMVFRDGIVAECKRTAAHAEVTGISISARLSQRFHGGSDSGEQIEEWLRDLLTVHPTLKLYLNDRRLQSPEHGDVQPCAATDQASSTPAR